MSFLRFRGLILLKVEAKLEYQIRGGGGGGGGEGTKGK